MFDGWGRDELEGIELKTVIEFVGKDVVREEVQDVVLEVAELETYRDVCKEEILEGVIGVLFVCADECGVLCEECLL